MIHFSLNFDKGVYSHGRERASTKFRGTSAFRPFFDVQIEKKSARNQCVAKVRSDLFNHFKTELHFSKVLSRSYADRGFVRRNRGFTQLLGVVQTARDIMNARGRENSGFETFLELGS